MSNHVSEIHTALICHKRKTFVGERDLFGLRNGMPFLAKRMRDRIAELGLKQNEIAKRAGLSAQRFGNYAQGTRTPDVDTLARIAGALETSCDWLLGASESGPAELGPVIVRLLELEGLPAERAVSIAAAAQEALRILSALPSEGPELLRSRMAAQAAWQSRHGPKPGQ